MHNPNDLFVLLEVNQETVKTSEPMELDKLSEYITAQYGDQPLRYFNDYRRLKIIHLKTGEIRTAKVSVTF
jgi:hypothetical protein